MEWLLSVMRIGASKRPSRNRQPMSDGAWGRHALPSLTRATRSRSIALMPASQPRPTADRPDLPTGTVTLLFTDIEGSTRLSQQLGDTRYRTLLEEHRRILRDAVTEHGGLEFGTEGDALFAVFISASKAAAAAVAAQRALAAHPWPDDGRISVRMGLHTGEVAREGDGGYVGIALHRVARIAAAGHGGQVLLSSATRVVAGETLPAGIGVRDLGEHHLKDFDAAERIYQVTAADLRTEFPGLRTIDATPNNLPRQLTSFIGREDAIAEARRLFNGTRLLTLTGPGGTGKTRLSLRLAEDLVSDFPDGVYFVALGPIRDPELVPSVIAGALRLVESSGRTPLDAVVDYLRDRRVLLVLDNFEQVIPAAPVVSELIRGAREARIVVTSRAPLRVSGEQELPVPPLGLPDPAHLPPASSLSQYDAVALFIERAATVRPDFRITTENAPAIAEICARLDGLPLAIELAAARVRLLSPQAILTRLERRLGLLSGGARDLPERQQTLRGAISWSHDLLDQVQQALFARLSVFVGGCSLTSAQTVCDPDGDLGGDVLDILSALVDQSLVRQEDRTGEPRFRMLETIREFAAEQLASRGEEAATRERHAYHFRDVAEAAAPHLTGVERARWLDLLEDDHDNFRAAIAWSIEVGDAVTGCRLLAALWRFWQSRDHLVEGAGRAEAILALPGTVPPAIHARAHEAAGGIAWWAGDIERVQREYEEAARLAREVGEPRLLADALYNLSFPYSVSGPRGDSSIGAAFIDEAVTLYRSLGDESGLARAMWGLGNIQYFAGNFERVRGTFAEALALSRKVGDTFMTAWALHMLGSTEVHTGHLASSWGHLREAIEMMRAAGETTGLVLALDDFSDLANAAGDLPRAARLAGAARSLEDATGTRLAGISARLMARSDRTMEALPPEQIAKFAAEGRALTLDEAVELALGLPKPGEAAVGD